MFTKIFKELGLSDLTEQVFSDLVSKGPSTARQLSDRISIPRPSVYDHLKILISKGLVMERDEEGKKVFCVDDVKNISELLNEKIKLITSEKNKFETSIASLLKKTAFVEPKIRFYSGKEGVKQVINNIMLNRNIETMLMWPMSEMMKVLGSEYLEEINIRRIEKNIKLRVVWPEDKQLDTKKFPYLEGSKETLRDLRLAPKGMTWDMGYWMYGDKVIFLSSEKEGFGFVVQSKDFANLMRVQFEEIWKVSRPIK